MYMFAGYTSICHSRGVCLVEVFAHATCVFVYRGDCKTHICVYVSTDGVKMTKSTGVYSTVLWGLNTTDMCKVRAIEPPSACAHRDGSEYSDALERRRGRCSIHPVCGRVWTLRITLHRQVV